MLNKAALIWSKHSEHINVTEYNFNMKKLFSKWIYFQM